MSSLGGRRAHRGPWSSPHCGALHGPVTRAERVPESPEPPAKPGPGLRVNPFPMMPCIHSQLLRGYKNACRRTCALPASQFRHYRPWTFCISASHYVSNSQQQDVRARYFSHGAFWLRTFCELTNAYVMRELVHDKIRVIFFRYCLRCHWWYGLERTLVISCLAVWIGIFPKMPGIREPRMIPLPSGAATVRQ